MDATLRDDFQLYFRLALFTALTAYTVIKVNKAVPQAYLDEEFHIRQAQRYCLAHFRSWDSKITTPPGLYILAYIWTFLVQIFHPIYQLLWVFNPLRSESRVKSYTKFTRDSIPHCSTPILRGLNALGGTLILPWLCYEISLYLHSPLHRPPPPKVEIRLPGSGPGGTGHVDEKEIEKVRRRTELPPGMGPKEETNIDTEERMDAESKAAQTGLNIALFPLLYFFNTLFYTDVWSAIFVLFAYRAHLMYSPWKSAAFGLISVTFRQTNILWVFFLIAQNAIRRIKQLHPPSPTPDRQLNFRALLGRAYVGGLYDVSINNAQPLDYYKCILSILVSTYNNLQSVIVSIEPYLYIIVSFIGFVWYNGGVTMGDKENHTFTQHPTQILYFFLFTVLSTPTLFIAPFPIKSLLSPLGIGASSVALGIISYWVQNYTITHSFMLADNRHYVFYLWRRTILAAPEYRFYAVPIYFLSGFLVIRALGNAKNTASFVLSFMMAMGGSLILAPLVEFRYFVVAWTIWRLNVVPSQRWGLRVLGVDWRVWLEMMGFLAVHAGTMWVFLNKTFKWENEPGLMRFMW